MVLMRSQDALCGCGRWRVVRSRWRQSTGRWVRGVPRPAKGRISISSPGRDDGDESIMRIAQAWRRGMPAHAVTLLAWSRTSVAHASRLRRSSRSRPRHHPLRRPHGSIRHPTWRPQDCKGAWALPRHARTNASAGCAVAVPHPRGCTIVHPPRRCHSPCTTAIRGNSAGLDARRCERPDRTRAPG